MGMITEGRARVRWIRFLVLVLALTASRGNFPLRAWSAAPAPETSKQLTSKGKSAKKSEGVIPSRRYVENRRTDWLKRVGGEAGSPAVLEVPQTPLETPVAGPRKSLPDHRSFFPSDALAVFIRTVSVSALPPPA
jgi:hypothetical protein